MTHLTQLILVGYYLRLFDCNFKLTGGYYKGYYKEFSIIATVGCDPGRVNTQILCQVIRRQHGHHVAGRADGTGVTEIHEFAIHNGSTNLPAALLPRIVIMAGRYWCVVQPRSGDGCLDS
ncbi:hypothetical protein [Arthrobacter sp. SDTb3-6]|uniref:hypothetical protein n=1 Tax=Arthrobacter sp. SDTb3-6 TaxID=2713571 RepID=UPI00159DF6DC|nr:hypothetical protein [Arthrobacter sp. SDTb3-6]NVM98491.1 hypothetical protein [Arthrobacter sp. SDTb3-6]